MSRRAQHGRDWSWALWLPGLLVGLGAAAATAHGLYEVAVGAGVPRPIAWLYPLITDGLALVAYASTARLVEKGRGYAWCVVVLAAGLSGLAQAGKASGWLDNASAGLRFGVGAWPAIAAAIVAHLLFMLGTHDRTRPGVQPSTEDTPAPVQPEPVQPEPVQPGSVQSRVSNSGVQPSPVQPGPFTSAVQRPGLNGPVPPHPSPPSAKPGARMTERRPGSSSAPRDRARAAARRHAAHDGGLPTVRQLMDLAQVSQGTAATALQELRDQPAPLHVITEQDTPRTQP